MVERTVDVHLGKGMRSSREGGKSSIGTFRKAQAQATKAMLRISGAAQRMPVSSHVGEAEAKQVCAVEEREGKGRVVWRRGNEVRRGEARGDGGMRREGSSGK